MTRSVIIGAIAVVLLGGGAAAYILTKDDDKNATNNTSQQSQNGQSGAAFNPASTEGLEFKATITTQNAGQATKATLEHDDKGNNRYVSSSGGQQTEIIYTSDAYYSCQGSNCTKFPVSQSSSSGFNPGDYTYSESKLAGYRSGSTYKGKQDCPSGTCDVWSVTAGGVTSTLYVDTDTGYITQVESTVNGATSKIVYEYTDVTINVPANAQTVPTQ
jgi:hypothetical protein